MKIIIADEYEFDSPSSEEYLIVAVAKRTQFMTFAEFLTAIHDNDNFPDYELESFNLDRQALQDFESGAFSREYLEYFSGAGQNDLENGYVCVLSDDWNDLDILIESPNLFIRYYWSTSA